MGRGDGGLATGDLPQSHHVVRGKTLVTGSNLVHSCHFEGVHREGLEVRHVKDCLGRASGEDLVGVPVGVLAFQDVDDVVSDLAVVAVERWGPGQHTAPRVELHDQRLPRPAGDVWQQRGSCYTI